jgi:hypothetical protein
LNNDGTFTLSEWIYSNGKAQSVSATGTYSVSQNCTLSLTFSSTPSGPGVTFQAPLSFQGILDTPSNSSATAVSPASGGLIIQPQNVTTVIGRFVSQ